jgi:hypothetical protein
MRLVSDKNILKNFCENFCKVVDKHCKYIVVSGYLVIAAGRSRGTEDIDMIIERLDKSEFKKLHRDLIKNGFICVQDDSVDEIYGILNERSSVRYVCVDRLIPEMEIKFAKDELDILQLNLRNKIPEVDVNVWFGSIDMNIAFKEEYLRSDKDLLDAKHLRIYFKGRINEDKINFYKARIKELRLNEKKI